MKKKSEVKAFQILHPKRDGSSDNLQLLRVTVTTEHTKLDFGYQAPDYYTRGGWVTMNPASYIQIKDSKIKYTLLHASNIPYGPEQLHFNSTNDCLYFSLIFQAIPPDSAVISLIEKEKPTDTDFNIYNIRLDAKEKRMELFGWDQANRIKTAQ